MVAIGAYVGLSDYWSKQPSISLKIVDVTVIPSRPNSADVLHRLREVERKYIDYTGFDVLPLLDSIDEGAGDISHDFADQLDAAIESIKARSDYDGLILELRSIQDDLVQLSDERRDERLEQLEAKYRAITQLHILSLIDSIKSDPDLSQRQISEALSEASFAFAHGRDQVALALVDLEDIKSKVTAEDIGKRSRLQVDVVIENRSRIDNAVRRKAVMSVSSRAVPRLFELDLLDDNNVPHSSMVNRRFQSRHAESEDEKDRDAIKGLVDRQCKVAIMDVHGGVWVSERSSCGEGVEAETDVERLEEHLRSRSSTIAWLRSLVS